jgi:hypothetical protein
MASKRDTIDEIDGTSRSLVEIPIPLSDRFAFLLCAALLAGTVPALIGVALSIGLIEVLLWPLRGMMIGFVLLFSLMASRRCLDLASRPDFAVREDGLLLRDGGIQNHYEWEEVWYCHWSHFEPGVLNIQVGTRFGWSGVSLPPRRLFRPIPEAYRAQVEKAIRTIGMWAEGDSDSALLPPVSWGEYTSGLKAIDINEFDETQVALVEIPTSRRRLVASFFPALLWVCWGATTFGPENAPMTQRWFGPLLFGCAAVVALLSALSRASRPEFAVFKEGIWLPLERPLNWLSPWSPSAVGLIAWDEVSYCRWSQYVPGILTIQVARAQSLNQFKRPPTRLEYRVPEEYQPSVEKAIRAMAKWAE